jgi:hypothetical protein
LRSNNAQNATCKPTEPPHPIVCNVCGNEIKGAKRGAQTLTGAMIAQQTGGMCLKCYKAAQT